MNIEIIYENGKTLLRIRAERQNQTNEDRMLIEILEKAKLNFPGLLIFKSGGPMHVCYDIDGNNWIGDTKKNYENPTNSKDYLEWNGKTPG